MRATFFEATVLALRALVGTLAAVLVRLEGRTLRRGAAYPSERWAGSAALSGRLLESDGVDEGTRRRLAAAWRASACAAHEGLAVAAGRALKLATLGAPPELVVSAHEDALDRIRLVKVGFAMAGAIDGGAVKLVAPCASAPAVGHGSRPLALAHLAVEVVTGMALGGASSGRTDAKLARRTTDASIREALEETASLKAAQIGRAWAIVAWCLDEEPEVVGHALAAVRHRLHSAAARRDRLPDEARAVPTEASEGGWERWGIAGRALEEQERRRALEAIASKLGELVGAGATTSFRRLAA